MTSELKEHQADPDQKQLLIFAVEGTAEWRVRKSNQYPADRRNERSALALAALARRLELVPASHPGIRAVSRFLELGFGSETENAVYEFLERQRIYIGRYGFDYPEEGDPEAFLRGLVGLIPDVENSEAAA